MAICFKQVAAWLILSGLFQRAAAKNEEQKQKTREDNHRINIFLVKKLRSEPGRFSTKTKPTLVFESSMSRLLMSLTDIPKKNKS